MNGLRIASWPGREFTHNRFISILIGELEALGVEVVDLPRGRLRELDRVDAVLLHWPEQAMGDPSPLVTVKRMAAILARLAGRPKRVKLLWFVHNLAPHDLSGLRGALWVGYARGFRALVNGALTLSPGTVDLVAKAMPDLGSRLLGHVWHPAYGGEMLDEAARAVERSTLGYTREQFVFGYCGIIRPYKGMEALAKAFAATDEDDFRLEIAGAPMDMALTQALAAQAERDTRMRLTAQSLGDDAYRSRLNVCDLIVAPYRDYLHSGALIHAVSAGRAVLTPKTPFADSLAEAVGAEWVLTYEGELTAAVLRDAAARAPRSGAPDLAALDPAVSAQAVLAALRRLGATPAALKEDPA